MTRPADEKTPGTHQKTPEGADAGHPQLSPVAHLAIRAFSELDKEYVQDLVEAAGEGDADAREELQLDQLNALETLIDHLDHEESLELIKIGMMLTKSASIQSCVMTGTFGFVADEGTATGNVIKNGLDKHGNEFTEYVDCLHQLLTNELVQLESISEIGQLEVQSREAEAR